MRYYNINHTSNNINKFNRTEYKFNILLEIYASLKQNWIIGKDIYQNQTLLPINYCIFTTNWMICLFIVERPNQHCLG